MSGIFGRFNIKNSGVSERNPQKATTVAGKGQVSNYRPLIIAIDTPGLLGTPSLACML